MKVKSLYPVIISSDLNKTIQFYRNLGFEIKHDSRTLAGPHWYVLANNALQFELIECSEKAPIAMEPGLFGLRMNVDNIEDALAECKKNHVKIIAGPFNTIAGRNLLIHDNNGVNIMLMQHIKIKNSAEDKKFSEDD